VCYCLLRYHVLVPIGGERQHTAWEQAVGRDELEKLVFVSSDFTRARETAEECRAAVVRIAEFEREVRCVRNAHER
jgi:broad specificity phosphatase PhoE